MNIAISLIAFDNLRLGKCTLCSHDYIRSIISDFFSCLNLIHELTEFSCTFICGLIYWCCSFSLFYKVNVGFFFLNVFISSELKESINTLPFFFSVSFGFLSIWFSKQSVLFTLDYGPPSPAWFFLYPLTSLGE